jgi:hypothetical protein
MYMPTKVDINLRDDEGGTALHLLAGITMSNDVKQEIIDYILDKRPNINLSLEDKFGQTAADVFGRFQHVLIKRKLEMFNIDNTKMKEIRKNSADMMLDPEQYMYIAQITKRLHFRPPSSLSFKLPKNYFNS